MSKRSLAGLSIAGVDWRERWSRVTLLTALVAGLCCLCGCNAITYVGTDYQGEEYGITYYVGGAGPLGHIGTTSVPGGLRDAGYRYATEAFGWQSVVGGTLLDQVFRTRNLGQAQRLARRIERYADKNPRGKINIIALSAGTGIATWAIEDLRPDIRLNTVIYLGSSLSRDYDLSRALDRVDGKLYNFHSPNDDVLRLAVPLTGTVDRDFAGPGGLYGFIPPPLCAPDVRMIYRERLRNVPYRSKFARYDNKGGHTDGTNRAFVREILAPLILEPIAASAMAREEKAREENSTAAQSKRETTPGDARSGRSSQRRSQPWAESR